MIKVNDQKCPSKTLEDPNKFIEKMQCKTCTGQDGTTQPDRGGERQVHVIK